MFNKTVLINYLKALIEKDEIANTLLLTLNHKYYCVYNHCLNVSVSSYLLCYKMNMTIDESISVALGGLLHDIGKLTIPSKILYKYGTLNLKEWNIIKRHPISGVNLLSNSKYLDKVNNSILYHHERYDGKGYCSNLKGKDIPLHARIIGICDSFDAMISYRSYRDTLSLEEAKDELIRNKNTQFDGYLIDNFLEIIDDYYTKYYNTESPLYIKDFISTKEDTDGGANWETILDNLPDIGVILIDKHDEIKFCNKFAASIRNKDKAEVVRINFANLHKKHRNGIIEEKLSKVKLGNINGWERTMKRGNIYLENKYISILNEKNKYGGLLMLTKDVSEQEKMLRLLERNIEYLNILVQGNSLLSRVYDLNQILKRALNVFNKIIDIDYINIFIKRYRDINNLKYINDTFGHLYGDLVIKTTAQILKKSVREDDYVFRYGGDEFMILAVNCNKNYIKSIIRKIHINIASVWDKKQKNARLTMSIGYSMSSKNIPINEVINIADENMYIEKNKFKSIKNYQNEPKSIFSLK
ncbi:HD domain-containing phosphohydrolase [Clostridium thailandense]|uniref:HD domain-containing phosphohydrolase n=1 Tax=Clostridium thailandense TaxID=2794346 RepID=UPI003989AC38